MPVSPNDLYPGFVFCALFIGLYILLVYGGANILASILKSALGRSRRWVKHLNLGQDDYRKHFQWNLPLPSSSENIQAAPDAPIQEKDNE